MPPFHFILPEQLLEIVLCTIYLAPEHFSEVGIIHARAGIIQDIGKDHWIRWEFSDTPDIMPLVLSRMLVLSNIFTLSHQHIFKSSNCQANIFIFY